MKNENFILYDKFDNALSKEAFDVAKVMYLQSLIDHPYEIKKAESIYDLIENIKRAPEKIGPYQNISVFESLNRIASDLILLSGASILFEGKYNKIVPKEIHLKMGTTKGFDFEVNIGQNKIIYGEAFNAAESFCKEKMRQAIHKLIHKNLDNKATEAIIFANIEMKDVLEKYENKKEKANLNFTIHKIYCEKTQLDGFKK
jgi:hypothetical protein